MATQREVAKLAGVSFITVSRVINNRNNVKEETRKRVLAAIKKLNYYPNSLARGLNSNSVNTIAIIVPTREGVSIHGTEFYNRIIEGAEQVCVKFKYDLIFPTAKAYGSVYDYLKTYYERKADGMLFIAPDTESSQMDDVVERKIPCVIVAGRPKQKIPFVDVNNFEGIVKAVDYLVRNGHSRIGFLKGIFDNQNAIDRLKGFRAGMLKNKLKIVEEWILDGSYTEESGKQAFGELLKIEERPTAIICANDAMAIGLCKEIRTLGFRVPEDFSVIGFDGIIQSAYTEPSLTTLRQPLVEMGRTAVEILFEKMKDASAKKESVILEAELLKRESVARI
ncbi:MAG: LacI family DNA-binding transcriptional regulator [Spirochaetales bacterium]|nr:LacI family DNA-binding transcriptional regulator [Spirochaetales bacterium]